MSDERNLFSIRDVRFVLEFFVFDETVDSLSDSTSNEWRYSMADVRYNRVVIV